MVKCTRRWEVVNGMSEARRRGHGCVTAYLVSIGVPRSTAYRWEQRQRWLLELGWEGVERLAREFERMMVLASLQSATVGTRRFTREEERAFILEAAVLGNSDTEIAQLLVRAFGRRVSHETVRATIEKAGEQARKVFERYFAGVGTVGAADEIFLGRSPLLLVAGPLSLLISGVRLCEGRTASDWKPVFEGMEDLLNLVSDGASGLLGAGKEAGAQIQRDIFHGLRHGAACLGRLEHTCEKRLTAEHEALEKLEKARGAGGKYQTNGPTHRYHRAQAEAERVLSEWVRLSDLFGELVRAFDLVTTDRRLNRAAEARATVAAVLEAMRESPEGRTLAEKLKGLDNPAFFTYLTVLEARLAPLRLEQVGPAREGRLAREVGRAVRWRRKDKTAVSVLARASTGSVADDVELAILEAVDHAVRSSSSVECVNSRVRLAQVARKRLSENYVYLMAVYHNVHAFGRGSVREGHSPAELAGIELPTADWIELLDLADIEEAAATASACEAARSEPAAANIEAAA